MNPETLEKLEALAVKLGTTSELLFGHLVHHVFVDALVSVVLLTVFTCIMSFVVWKIMHSQIDDEEGTVICGLIGGVTLFVFFIGMSLHLSRLFAPEGTAVKMLLEMLK